MKLLTKIQKPSPSAAIDMVKSKENSHIFSHNIKICKLSSLKRFSAFISSSKRILAGMTVEAAIVFPVFIIFLLHLGSVIEMIRLHNNIQTALYIHGSEVALYGSEIDGDENETEVVADVAAALFIRTSVIKTLGQDYLDNSPLKYGDSGLQMWESKLFTDNDELDVTMTYTVAPLISLVEFVPFRMVNRYFVHIWNGYGIDEDESELSQRIVYVTEYGQVWHSTLQCTHLNLSIHQVEAEQVGRQRNIYGSRYKACEKCIRDKLPSVLFITNDGTKYHSSIDCPGLTRRIQNISLSDAVKRGYRQCSRCGGK